VPSWCLILKQGAILKASKLVIFDCDGVLVDSEPPANRVFSQALQNLGLPYTYERTLAQFMGKSMKTCIAQIEAELGAPVPANFLTQLQHDTFAAFETELKPVTGIESALDVIQSQFATCVASSGDHQKLNFTLGNTGLKQRFEGRIYSATEVARGKPFPDLFLHAAKQMGFAASDCVVIEDSVFGAQAARAAQMPVFGYAAMSSAQSLNQAGAATFNDMAQLPSLIAQLFGFALLPQNI
jgi:HAD superfamily hydrolase (TIGR01509 family)